jgi:hypothetical protein
MDDVVRCRERDQQEHMLTLLLDGIASVFALRWNTVHVVAAQEAVR